MTFLCKKSIINIYHYCPLYSRYALFYELLVKGVWYLQLDIFDLRSLVLELLFKDKLKLCIFALFILSCSGEKHEGSVTCP